MTIQWKIFYAGGKTYSSLDGPPELAPKTGVLAIIAPDDRVGRRVERQSPVTGDSYYIWTPENGGWRGACPFRLAEYMFEPGYKLVLYGRTVTDKEYQDVLERAQNDPDLPPKSGWQIGERR